MRLLKIFLPGPLGRRGEVVEKIAGKIRYLIQSAFVDDPLVIYLL